MSTTMEVDPVCSFNVVTPQFIEELLSGEVRGGVHASRKQVSKL
jgi:hypothetical protein